MSPEPKPILNVAKLVKRFGGFYALDGLSFHVASGEILGLVGPNGSGKTTAINVVSGLYAPDGGEVMLDGTSIGGVASHRLVHSGINRTFQVPKPFLSLTVREDAVSAAMAGVNVVKMRVVAWLASALVAGLAGGIYAWYVSVFYPDNVFSGEFSIFAIVFALFGGVATIVGPIVGVIILYGVYNLIGFTTPQYFQLIYGLLIMGLVLFLPAGLVSLATRRGWHVP